MPPNTVAPAPKYTSHLAETLTKLELDDTVELDEAKALLNDTVRARDGEKQGFVSAEETADLLLFARDHFDALDDGTQRSLLRILSNKEVNPGFKLPFAQDMRGQVKNGVIAVDGQMPGSTERIAKEGNRTIKKHEVVVADGEFKDDQRVGMWKFQSLKGVQIKFYDIVDDDIYDDVPGKSTEVSPRCYLENNPTDVNVQRYFAAQTFKDVKEDTGLFTNFDPKRHKALVQWQGETGPGSYQLIIRLADTITGRTSDELVINFDAKGNRTQYFKHDGKEGPKMWNAPAVTSHNGDDRSGN